MTVDPDRLASVMRALDGRVVCAGCAEVFLEVLDAVRATTGVGLVPRPRTAGIFAVSIWDVETAPMALPELL
jgi:hypothetical protein